MKQMLILGAVFAAMPVFADWNFAATTAIADVDFGRTAVLTVRFNNVGDIVSPAQELQSYGGPILQGYQLTPLSGGCSEWRELSEASGSVELPVLRFSVPSVAPGASVICRYNVAALNANNVNVNTFFRALDRPNTLDTISIKIGALTDIGASARRLNSLAISAGVFINRYEITFSTSRGRTVCKK
jgi:hypothetical protein